MPAAQAREKLGRKAIAREGNQIGEQPCFTDDMKPSRLELPAAMLGVHDLRRIGGMGSRSALAGRTIGVKERTRYKMMALESRLVPPRPQTFRCSEIPGTSTSAYSTSPCVESVTKRRRRSAPPNA